MRRSIAVLLALFVVGCAAPQYQHQLTVPVTGEGTFEQARSELVDMGYTIERADREGGLIRAEKTSATGMMDLGRRTDRLTVSIGQQQVQVTAETDFAAQGEEADQTAVSDEAKADAAALREALSGQSEED